MTNHFMKYIAGIIALLSLSTCEALLHADGLLAIQGAKIIPVVGDPIAVGTILIRSMRSARKLLFLLKPK
jgi:hypothetical protein